MNKPRMIQRLIMQAYYPLVFGLATSWLVAGLRLKTLTMLIEVATLDLPPSCSTQYLRPATLWKSHAFQMGPRLQVGRNKDHGHDSQVIAIRKWTKNLDLPAWDSYTTQDG